MPFCIVVPFLLMICWRPPSLVWRPPLDRAIVLRLRSLLPDVETWRRSAPISGSRLLDFVVPSPLLDLLPLPLVAAVLLPPVHDLSRVFTDLRKVLRPPDLAPAPPPHGLLFLDLAPVLILKITEPRRSLGVMSLLTSTSSSPEIRPPYDSGGMVAALAGAASVAHPRPCSAPARGRVREVGNKGGENLVFHFIFIQSADIS